MTEEQIKTKIEELEKEKSTAISQQHYDKAAHIRDQIAALQNTLRGLSNASK